MEWVSFICCYRGRWLAGWLDGWIGHLVRARFSVYDGRLGGIVCGTFETHSLSHSRHSRLTHG